MHDEDARDLGIHDEIDACALRIARANGKSRAWALSYIDGFLENDPESPRYTIAPTFKAKRPRTRRRQEAHA